MSSEGEQYDYVPYFETVEASVWCVDAGLARFTSMSEEQSWLLAEEYPDFIFFFAELVA